jgi:hydrogenase nickel incorporation protein HypA/HybF
MHELSIAQGILGIVKEEASTHKLARISSIKLKIGLLRAVVPEALSFCFEALVKDTPLAKAKLEIEMVPIKGRCKNCGQQFKHTQRIDFFFRCPSCGKELEIMTGEELYIEQIEGE